MTPQDWKDEERDIEHRVVVNDEEQLSILPVGRDLPPGWRDEGTRGTRQECLDHVAATWTDMRPASLRAQGSA